MPADWTVDVLSGDKLLVQHVGSEIPENMWNKRRQLTFTIEGSGLYELRVNRHDSGDEHNSLRFDCWTSGGENTSFHNFVDPTLISEPAIFPQVLAVGLRVCNYSPDQSLPGHKPDILLDGFWYISFRLPEVTVAVAELLQRQPGADVDAVRALLGKYPQIKEVELADWLASGDN